MGSFTRNSLIRMGARIFPSIPVTITAATVMGTMPPWLSATAVAIGVVTDLGSRDIRMARSRPKSLHRTSTLPIEATAPARQPASTGAQYCFSRSFLA